MKRLLLLSLALASAALLLPAADPPSLTGDWKIVSNIGGGERHSQCAFTQKESTLTGTCRSEAGSVEITGKLEGNKVAWGYKTEYQGSPLTVSYKGTIESPAKITGTVTAEEFGVEGDFTATPAPAK